MANDTTIVNKVQESDQIGLSVVEGVKKTEI